MLLSGAALCQLLAATPREVCRTRLSMFLPPTQICLSFFGGLLEELSLLLLGELSLLLLGELSLLLPSSSVGFFAFFFCLAAWSMPTRML